MMVDYIGGTLLLLAALVIVVLCMGATKVDAPQQWDDEMRRAHRDGAQR